MSIPCIASIDQGTSSSRVLLINSNGKIIGSHQVEHTQYYPVQGQVEHDPLEIWNAVKLCLSQAIESTADPSNVKVVSIGITNQRETTVVWNKDTGAPYHKAIVWNDTRTAPICDNLAAASPHGRDRFRDRTGLPIAPYFSATKLLYLMDVVPGLRKDAEDGKALFGTIDTWIIWKLTNGRSHATDVSNASRTLLMNLETLKWDETILSELNIPVQMLPTINPSSFLFGSVDSHRKESIVEHDMIDPNATSPALRVQHMPHYERYHDVPIHGVLGDQQAALFGQACFKRGDMKCTYGTGAFMLMNTGNKIVQSKHGLLTTVAYQLSTTNPSDGSTTSKPPVYALEGSIAYSGSVIQWLRDNLQMVKNAKESEQLARSVADNGGVYFVPAFAGLYAPHWRSDARGIIMGLTAFNTKAHIVRAALEASAFQTIDVARAMMADTEHSMPMNLMKVDGGVTANSTLMQFQSDVLDVPLVRPQVVETTAMGAAFVAGLGVGMWKHEEEIQSVWQRDAQWEPSMPAQLRESKIKNWNKAVERSKNWIEDDSRKSVANGNSAVKQTSNVSNTNTGGSFSEAAAIRRLKKGKFVVGAVGLGLGMYVGYVWGQSSQTKVHNRTQSNR